MKKLFIALLAALLLAFAACAAPQQETAAPEPAQSEPASAVSWDDLTFDRTLPLQYATQFSVSYAGEDYTRLTIGDDQTFLVVAGDAPVPDGVPADGTVLTRPLSHIYLVATAAMDYFRQLDAIDAIALSGQKEADWYIDEAKAAMQAGTMVYAGKYSAPDYETILAAGCDLAIENTMIYHTPEVVEQLEVRAKLFAENLDNLLRLALAEQTVVDMDADELLADRLDEQRRDDGAVDAAGQGEQDVLVADLRAERSELFFDERLRKLRRGDTLHGFRTFVVHSSSQKSENSPVM